MPYPQTTPYDILGVTPAVTRDQLKKAYEQAMRGKKYSATKVTKAYNDLRSGRKRLETDLFLLSQSGDPADLTRLMSQLPPCEYIVPQVMPITLPYADILLLDFIQDAHETEVPSNPYDLQSWGVETAPKTVLFTPSFPW